MLTSSENLPNEFQFIGRSCRAPGLSEEPPSPLPPPNGDYCDCDNVFSPNCNYINAGKCNNENNRMGVWKLAKLSPTKFTKTRVA